MNIVRSLPSKSGLPAFAAAFLLALLGVLLTASPASAHGQVKDSTPANLSVVDAAPEAVDLVFSDTPAAKGAKVQVLDESGTDWAEGDVRVLDNTVTQPLRSGAPAGTYTVLWSVVSEDAHRVGQGESITFTVSDGSTSVPSTAAPSAGASAPSTAAPMPDATQSPVLNRSDDTGSPWPVIVPAAVVLVAVAVLIALVVRRRLRED